MAYPASLDTFPTSADLADDTLATKPHSTLHGNLGDAVAAVEAKVGVDASAVATTHDYKLANDVVLKALYDAHTVLIATSDNTPLALTMGASTVLARLAAGNIVAATPDQLTTLLALAAADISDFDTAVATTALLKVAGGASVENIGAVESNVNTVATTGAAETLDTAVYGVHDCTMDQACTFTFSNPAPSGKNTTFVLILRGAFTPTLPASIDWGDAAAPTYTTPSVYIFTTVDAGTIWLGSQMGKAFG